MTQLSVVRVALSLTLRLSAELLERHFVSSPRVLGERLAEEVNAYVEREGLGYYPPLEYFRSHAGIDSEVLEIIEETGWVVCRLAREVITTQLRPVFSRIEIQQIQPRAHTMPRVRVNQSNALAALARHYSPDAVRLTLIVSSLEKNGTPEGIERLAERKIWHWLQEHFDAIEVSGARLA